VTEPAIVRKAQEIADAVLFPAALATERSELAGRALLDVLAEAGLYGIDGPPEYGGLDTDVATHSAVVEALASGCLTTTFIWNQHHTPVRTVRASKDEALRAEWLPRLCSGSVRSGVALGGTRAGLPQLKAREIEGGWLLDGVIPFQTGWGRIDVILVTARTDDGRVVRGLIDAAESPSLQRRPLALIAANASGTGELTFAGHFLPAERVTAVDPYEPPPAYDGGGRVNGSLALGVTRRCCMLIGPSPLDGELAAVRRQLNEASDETRAVARAAASELAWRAAGTLVVKQGSRALAPEGHAGRLLREAAFTLVFGTRPAIRSALLDRLTDT
jgi:alkylation response protein AidB-like acyl-CoA dehydrogenase